MSLITINDNNKKTTASKSLSLNEGFVSVGDGQMAFGMHSI
jgi:hypothetical protein